MEMIRDERAFKVKPNPTNKDQSKTLRTAITAVLFVALGLVSACGGSGGSSSAPAPEPEPVPTVPEPEVVNSAPLADAGADQGATEQEPVMLSGVGSSDSDGRIESYFWRQTEGTGVELSDETDASPTFNAPVTYADESLIFELTVTDDNGATAEDTVVVNITDIPSPEIVDVQPVDLTKDVERSGDITVQFSEAILPESINNSRFTLQGPSGVVAASVSVSEDGITATLTPDKKLAVLTPYTATLAGEISGELNNGLGVDVSWSFVTTPDRNWEEAELLEHDDAWNASKVQFEFDRAGNAIAVWRQFNGDQYNIWANRFTVVDSEWGDPIMIDSENLGLAQGPQITFDASGSALVVWAQNNDEEFRIWSNHYDANKGWGAEAWSGAVEVDSDDLDANNPQIAFDGGGKAWVVWEQVGVGASYIWGSRYTFSSRVWDPSVLIDSGSEGDELNVRIAFNDNGDGVAVWERSDGELVRIWSSRVTSGGEWGSPEIIDLENNGIAETPKIALDSKGNTLAVWTHFDGVRYAIWENYYSVPGGWLGAKIIDSEDLNGEGGWVPDVAMNSDGNAIVAWLQVVGDSYGVGVNYYVTGAGWAGVELFEFDSPGTNDSVLPDVSIDGGGNAFVAWWEGGSGKEDIWVNRYTASSVGTTEAGWSVATALESDLESGVISLKLAADSQGNALAVWLKRGAGPVSVKAKRYD